MLTLLRGRRQASLFMIKEENIMDNENKELLGLNLGHDDFINALVNKNPGPGQVINAHRVFAAIYAMADEEPKAAKMALDKIFGIGKRGEHYVSPIPPMVVKENLTIKNVSFSMVHEAVVSARKAEFSSVEEMKSCADDFTTFARMFSEAVIDAAKKGGIVPIEYIDVLRSAVKPESLLHTEKSFNAEINWMTDKPARKGWVRHQDAKAKGAVDVLCQQKGKNPYRFVAKENGTQFVLEDPWHELSVDCLNKAVDGYAAKVTELEPHLFSSFVKAVADRRAEDMAFDAICVIASKLWAQMNRTITSGMTAEKSAIETTDKDQRRAEERAITARYRETYAELGNEIRRQFGLLKSNDMTEMAMVNAVVNAAYHDEKGKLLDDVSASNFADNVIGEEFFSWLKNLLLQKKENVTEEAVEPLIGCDFEEGSEIVFKDSFVEKNGHYAMAERPNVNGSYVIKKVGGKWTATKKIDDIVESSIDFVENQVMFMTSSTPETKERLVAMAKAASVKGAKVTLVHNTKVNGVRQAIFVDGKAYGRYANAYADLSKKKDREAAKKLGLVMDNVYDLVQGDLKDIKMMSYTDEHGRKHAKAVVVLENVTKVAWNKAPKFNGWVPVEKKVVKTAKTVKTNFFAAKKPVVKEEPKKTSAKSDKLVSFFAKYH